MSAFLAAAVLATIAAYFSARLIEDSSIIGVQSELDRDGLTWSTVDANGLQVFLAGTAPTEADRFQAVSAAGRVVDAARVIDQMTVTESESLAPPRFSVEILRNDAGLSIIGLVPASTNTETLLSTIRRRVGQDVPISDFLESADFDTPEGWDDALNFAVSTLGDLPRSKISVESGQVSVKAMTVSTEAKRRLEAEIVRRAPGAVRVALDLSAPRPVISPFSLRFVADENGPRLDTCSADTEAAREKILKAAADAGLDGDVECRIGLGVPTRQWSDAAEQAIAAIATLGGGEVTFSDADISLLALEGTEQALFDRVIGELENDLPSVFALSSVLPKKPDQTDEGPPEFIAIRTPEGQVQMRGRINSAITRQTAESFAKASFGSAMVDVTARIDETLPASWSVRVLASIATLNELANGAVVITPTEVTVTGDTGNANANADITALLTERLGEGQNINIDVTYQKRLDPLLGIPTPAECVEGITEIIGQRKITFEPGSATLDAATQGIMDEISDLLKKCEELPLVIAGHTDSQGRESMNQQLSQSRAEAVLSALRDRRVLTASYEAVGYGETQPIADNGTEAGREANRRIEFKLLETDVAESDLESDAQTGEDPVDAAQETPSE